MSSETLTRADLTEAVFQSVGLSRTDSAQMVEDMLEEVCGALAKGETVKLSSFGTFAVRQKSQRMGRNPPPAILVRPGDMVEAVRAAMMLGATISDLKGEADVLGVAIERIPLIFADAGSFIQLIWLDKSACCGGAAHASVTLKVSPPAKSAD